MEVKNIYTYLNICEVYISTMYQHRIRIIYYWLLMLDNCCNPISFGYYGHDHVVVQSYSCVHEGVCCRVVNLAYRYMNTWYICVCNITHGHFFPAVAYVISVLLSHLLICFAVCAFGFCQVFGVGNQYLLDEISHLNVCLQIKYLIPIHFRFQFWERL